MVRQSIADRVESLEEALEVIADIHKRLEKLEKYHKYEEAANIAGAKSWPMEGSLAGRVADFMRKHPDVWFTARDIGLNLGLEVLEAPKAIRDLVAAMLIEEHPKFSFYRWMGH